jgi:hypothetical protein
MATPFRPAFTLLASYAEYHRDRRNIQTHLVGVPLIVFAIGVLLSRPAFEFAGLALTPAWVMFALTAAWYLTRGELALGVAVTAMVGALIALAHRAAAARHRAVAELGRGPLRRRLGHPVRGPLLRGAQARLCRRHRGAAGGPDVRRAGTARAGGPLQGADGAHRGPRRAERGCATWRTRRPEPVRPPQLFRRLQRLQRDQQNQRPAFGKKSGSPPIL